MMVLLDSGRNREQIVARYICKSYIHWPVHEIMGFWLCLLSFMSENRQECHRIGLPSEVGVYFYWVFI